ncbi:unnamed protein product [[Actinomadura] parvosata subsp. kistnae]|nr:unnamed protein product [Actinomadura parvosata subsp. kistnae]
MLRCPLHRHHSTVTLRRRPVSVCDEHRGSRGWIRGLPLTHLGTSEIHGQSPG